MANEGQSALQTRLVGACYADIVLPKRVPNAVSMVLEKYVEVDPSWGIDRMTKVLGRQV